MNTNSNGRLKGAERLSERPQFNVRIPAKLKEDMQGEIARQGRKRDEVAIRIFKHFLSLKPSTRDEICSKAA